MDIELIDEELKLLFKSLGVTKDPNNPELYDSNAWTVWAHWNVMCATRGEGILDVR